MWVYLWVYFFIELMVQFSKNSYSGSEESGVVPVTLSLLGGTSTRDITVTVILSERTAKGKIWGFFIK